MARIADEGTLGGSPGLVAALIACLSVASPSGAVTADRSGPGFSQAGSCTEAIVNIPVETSRLAEHVPDRFTIVEVVPGRAVVSVWAARCETSIDSAAPIRGFLGGVFTAVRGVPCEGEISTFSLSWVTDRRAVYRAWRRLDHGELVGHATFDQAHTAGVARRVRGEIGGGSSPFTLDAFTFEGEPDALSIVGTPCHWTAGRKGFIRGTYRHDFTMLGSGYGEVVPGTDSTLGDLLGGRSASGPALFASFSYSGVVEIVE